MNKVLKASGNEVESYWPGLFAKALKGKNIEELISNVAAAPAAGAPAAAAGGDAPAAAKEEEKPKEEEEEADVDMGDLFGGDY